MISLLRGAARALGRHRTSIMDDRVRRIRDLIAAQPVHTGGLVERLRCVCQAAAGALSASGTGISVLTDDRTRGVYAASDTLSERMEELQFLLGEGPCLDAFDRRRPVLIAELDEEAMSRWPIYAPEAHDRGVRAIFAFPLQIGAARLGVLDVFRDHAGRLSEQHLADALCFADVAVEAVLDRRKDDAGAPSGPPHESVTDAIGNRAELFQAQGMIMVQIQGSITDAAARIRAYAYAENRSLGEVARDIVAGNLRFETDRP
ncbi:GAF domain-containing protein [Actinoplanes sp. NPDC020271]|uniref:GAF domain-containing protein n=1 Tax=Actinoplanes sp. NPDC020271 TaxID=3363896 RepID=UPI0037B8F5AC